VRVLALTPPGRLPTTVSDLGLWWDRAAENPQHELLRFSASHAWWLTICGASIKDLILEPYRLLERWRWRALWRSQNIALKQDGQIAVAALADLSTPAPYSSASTYLKTIAPLAHYLADLNRAQNDIDVGVDYGAHVRRLNYIDSATLVRYSEQNTLLSRTIAAALDQCPQRLGFIAVSVAGLEELLAAMIASRHLRAANPGVHICLIDHGYENFSLHSHMDELRKSGTLDGVFDSIVVSKDDRDDVVPALIDAIAEGRSPRGQLTRASFPELRPQQASRISPSPPLPTFAPEPILVTRLSKRRCYWSRCTYCAHNNKYDDKGAPTRAEIPGAVDRIEAFVAAGYSRYVNFADEALSPAALRALARELYRRNLELKWVCRSKIELAHDAELFAELGRAGCKEIQYGLETTSPRVLKLMDKYVEGIDEPRLGQMFGEMQAAGIGVHVNLIGGFPADTIADTEGSVDFLLREFGSLRSASYFISAFTLLPDTPVVQAPQRFGLRDIGIHGDIAQALTYRLDPEISAGTDEVMEAIPRLDNRLADGLGWSRLGDMPTSAMLKALYFGSGHGSLFKARADNPFANPKSVVFD
jgi:hypothetical protein